MQVSCTLFIYCMMPYMSWYISSILFTRKCFYFIFMTFTATIYHFTKLCDYNFAMLSIIKVGFLGECSGLMTDWNPNQDDLLEQGALFPQSTKGWPCPDMTEKMLTGMFSLNTSKQNWLPDFIVVFVYVRSSIHLKMLKVGHDMIP